MFIELCVVSLCVAEMRLLDVFFLDAFNTFREKKTVCIFHSIANKNIYILNLAFQKLFVE